MKEILRGKSSFVALNIVEEMLWKNLHLRPKNIYNFPKTSTIAPFNMGLQDIFLKELLAFGGPLQIQDFFLKIPSVALKFLKEIFLKNSRLLLWRSSTKKIHHHFAIEKIFLKICGFECHWKNIKNKLHVCVLKKKRNFFANP